MPSRKVWHRQPRELDSNTVVVVVESGRASWEVAGLCIFVIIGVALVAGNPAPGSVDAALPGWIVQMWKAQLALGAVVGLVGVLLPQRTPDQLSLSLVVERAAMVWFGTATLAFPIVLAQTGQRPALTTIGYVLAYGLGALHRAWRTTRALRQLHPTERVPR
jgi:hypothetical protein